MPRLVSLVLAGLASLLLASPADPCAAVMRPGAGGNTPTRTGRATPAMRATEALRVAAEDVLIVWDAERKVQHFVRAVDFDRADPSFGFLVPTPTAPEVAEAPAEVFDGLKKLLVRPIVRRVFHKSKLGFRMSLRSLLLTEGTTLRGSVGAPVHYDTTIGGARVDVQFRSERPIAGFDVAVLAAKDTEALARWLKDNDFAYRPALDGWLKPYVENGWSITAFKLAASEVGKAGGRTRTRAVRMSFSAEHPFFPYREPADQRAPGAFAPGRVMRAFVVAPTRVDARADDGAAVKITTDYTRQHDDLAALLGTAVPADAIPARAWVTCLVDRSAPRQGDADLSYVPAADQTSITPPPVYDNHIKWDYKGGAEPLLILLLLIGAPATALAGRRRRPVGGLFLGAGFGLLFLATTLGDVQTRTALGVVACFALGFCAIAALMGVFLPESPDDDDAADAA